MTDADMIMNPRHFGSDLADIQMSDLNRGSLLVGVNRHLGGGLRSLSVVKYYSFVVRYYCLVLTLYKISMYL